MRFVGFGEHERGTLHQLLLDAYSGNNKLVNIYRQEWRRFDEFVYDNLDIMEACGFITEIQGQPVGFASWDPRMMPEYVELGHNCIITAHKGRGLGREQLRHALEIVKELGPARIIVKTGDIPFFEPARRMYLSAGFTEKRRLHLVGKTVPEAIEYELRF